MFAVINWNEVKEVPEPSPSRNEVLIEVRACGICGSDLHNVGGHFTSERIPGHEFSGIVTEVGEGVTNWAPGDRVVVNPQLYCGECDYCRRGDTNLCSNSDGVIGFQRDGGFAQKVAVPEYTLLPLPDGMSFEMGALADPIAVDLHALRLVDLSLVETTVVFGLGGIGLPMVNILRNHCNDVYGIDVVPRKLEIARKCGVNVIDATKEDIFEIFRGREVDLCVDAVGEGSPTFNQSLRLLKKRGVLLSVAQRPRFEMDYGPLGFKELTVKGVFAHTPRDFKEALQLLQHAPWVPEMITKRYGLKDFSQAIASAASGQELKVMVLCQN